MMQLLPTITGRKKNTFPWQIQVLGECGSMDIKEPLETNEEKACLLLCISHYQMYLTKIHVSL